LNGTRLLALGWSLILVAAIPAWVSSCTTEPSLRDGGGSGGNGSGGGAGSAKDGSPGDLSFADSGGAGMAGVPVDARSAAQDGSDAPEVDTPDSCPVINDPLAPAPGLISSTRVGVRAIIPVPFMIVFNASFAWTATDGPGQTGDGVFDDPSSASPTFSCRTPGDVTLTVHVGLPGTNCDASMSWVGSCRP
jgi:hypothetical protein